VLIALTSWTGIARLTRAEILRIKKLDYIQAAKALGYSQSRIIMRHALLNGLAPALVAIAFGVASTILIESSLSFLGIGLPIDTVTWGSMLSEGRTQFSAWWMTVFPGLAIFITVTIYNILGDALREIR
jgi:peptide/nickel transport system permease protein